ncbi:MAG: hypothetical protein WCA08_09460 [Desulfoferrobacter sp.]
MSLLPQVVINATKIGHKADETFGFVRIQLIRNKVIDIITRIGLDQVFYKLGKILFGARFFSTPLNCPCGGVNATDQCPSAVPLVSKLHRLGFAGSHGQIHSDPSQSLNTCHFINAKADSPRFFWHVAVDRADVGSALILSLICFNIQPAADGMGLQILFLESCLRGMAKCSQQYPA